MDFLIETVDEGWIHGIEGNPIAELARRNNLDLHVIPSETVIYGPDGKAVNQDEDERVEKLFNKLLEKARKVREHMPPLVATPLS
jgi:hypothetical protein